MDILFNNPIANLSGGWFLLFYVTVIVLTAIAFGLYKSRLDWTNNLPLPLVTNNPDPFEIAYLRGGENELARTVIFSLVQKKFLEIIADGTKNYIKLTSTQPNWTTLSEMERQVLKYFQATREVSEVFGSYGLPEILETYSLQYGAKIEQSNFLTPSDVVTKTRILSILIGLTVASLGIYKIVAAMINGRSNVIFTAVLAVIGFVIFVNLGKVNRLSVLGQKYVERLQQAFDNFKAKIQNPLPLPNNQAATFNSIDPFLLTVGVFGVGALAGTEFYEYEQAFHRSSAASSSGGCGSGCGSSSCSSGGDGGGGCGGCGGGD
jgi:uncharacterized protein (TIGR04222 family)